MGVAMPMLLFAILHAIVLSNLPLPHSERVALVYSEVQPGMIRGGLGISLPNLKESAGSLSGIEELGAFIQGVWTAPAQYAKGVDYLTCAEFDRGMLRLLDISPVLGRWPRGDELRTLSPDVVLVSERFWRNRLAAGPEAIGKIVLRIPRPVTVIGVLPASQLLTLLLPQEPDLIFSSPEPPDLRARNGGGYKALVRLRPGVSLSQVRAEMAVKARQLRAAYPRQTRFFNPRIVSLRSAILGRSVSLLWLLFGATGVVWLIATANFGALLAVRLEERRAELAIRAALGARGRHLVSAVAREVLQSAVIGAAAGALIAWVGIRFIQTHAEWFAMPRLADVRMDPATLLFGVSTALFAGVAALLLNGSQTLRSSPAGLVQTGFSQRISRPARFSEVVVAAQFCLALVVANTAAVTGHSLVRMESRVLGYDARDLLAMRISIPSAAGVLDRAGNRRDMETVESIIDFAARLPGVHAATAAYPRPGSNMYPPTFTFSAVGDAAGSSRPTPALKRDTFPNYFQAMHVPLLRGRLFLPSEDFLSDVAVVNEGFVRAYFGGTEPIGRELYWGSFGSDKRFRIVGIVGDSIDSLLDAAPPTVYLPALFGVTDLVIRTGSPSAVASQVAKFAGKLDPTLVVSNTQTIESAIQEPLAQSKTQTLLSTVFAVVSLLLAASGLYGVVRYAGETRRRDYAIRIALGATEAGLTRMRLYRTLRTVAYGLACGMAASVICGKIVESMLFGVPAIDPIMLALSSGILLMVGLAASYASIRDTAGFEPGDLLRSA
jgi:putative ABC transport system permease protein